MEAEEIAAEEEGADEAGDKANKGAEEEEMICCAERSGEDTEGIQEIVGAELDDAGKSEGASTISTSPLKSCQPLAEDEDERDAEVD